MLLSLVKSVLNVSVLPIEVFKDIVTIGGALTDEIEPYTMQRLKKAGDHLEDALS